MNSTNRAGSAGAQLPAHLTVCPDAAVNRASVISGNSWRITVLTARLVRIEYSENGHFVDEPSQSVWFRNFPKPEFKLYDLEDRLEIDTGNIHLYYDRRPFSKSGLYADVLGSGIHYGNRWYYGASKGGEFKWANFGGTARTLDAVNGAVELEDGIIARNGWAVLDDSNSLLLRPDGFVRPRESGHSSVDLYLFAYGRDFKAALRDFYCLTGAVPMLPRYALGNWWSRYYAYRQDEYLTLMDRFKSEELPFSVAVIDMDWHKTTVPARFGSGWTGYSWNRELFPDPDLFLSELHRRGMAVTLNLHPAAGVRAFEDCYPGAAKSMGIDPATEKAIDFDISDPRFLRTYFEQVHNPLEKQGVDFWWIDWQQGGLTRMEGLDPLWMLNHYHYLDNGRGGRRPLIFSRYAGPGSHRYPVGFSGDTITSWESLDFQPYFTATAANIGYGWWSHDIGGHMQGKKDDELVARWVQFGAFSPINRLHSSCSPFNGKEPWRYASEYRAVIADFLRLRHHLIPYLYTMNHSAHSEGRPVCLPLYYEYPQQDGAFSVRNGYFFGTELLCVPVTTPRSAESRLSKTRVWIPGGLWTDFFTGKVYNGGKSDGPGLQATLFRPLESIPLLAKPGALIPLSASTETANPAQLELVVFPGASNSFTMYEDDDSTSGNRVCLTAFSLDWPETGTGKSTRARVTIAPPVGDSGLIPTGRSWTVVLRGWDASVKVTARVKGPQADRPVSLRKKTTASGDIRFAIPVGIQTETIELFITGKNLVRRSDRLADLYALLDRAQMDFMLKDAVYNLARALPGNAELSVGLAALNLDRDLLQAIYEALLL